jgi:glucitol/sorbitol PTS system EIIC component
LGPLAIRFFLVGIIVILIRGVVTEFLTVRMMKSKGINTSNDNSMSA